MLFYHLTVAVIAFVLLAVCLWNIYRFHTLPSVSALLPDVFSGDRQEECPTISVCVPARNEERCIEENLRSLCEQDYPSFEVLVLDDQSTDRTPQIIESLALEYPNLIAISGNDKPDAWVGKSWACAQLAAQAKGTILLFTDADTVHHRSTLRAALQYAQESQVSFFSMIPTEVMGSFWEHVVLPMIHVLYFAYLPNSLITKSRNVSVSAANGQFMWFTKEAYQGIGTHAAVHDALVEDVTMARILKQAGYRIALVDGSQYVRCRMYTTGAEVFAGFSKNFFPATGNSIVLMGLLVSQLFCVFVAPVIFLVVESTSASPSSSVVFLTLATIAVGVIIREHIAIRFRMPWYHAFLMPLTALAAIGIAINSVRWAYRRQGAQWKGRNYVVRGR
jgi:chlorobactene glucosyltransferase